MTQKYMNPIFFFGGPGSLISHRPSVCAHFIEVVAVVVTSVRILLPNGSQKDKKISCGAQIFSPTNQYGIFRPTWSDWLIFLQFKLPAKVKQTRVRLNGRNNQNIEVPNEFRRILAFPNKQNITCLAGRSFCLNSSEKHPSKY